MNKNITIKGNIGNLPQGDEIFIDILEQLGVEVTVDDEQIKIKTGSTAHFFKQIGNSSNWV